MPVSDLSDIDRHDTDGRPYWAYYRNDLTMGFIWNGVLADPVQVTREMGEPIIDTFTINGAGPVTLANFREACDAYVDRQSAHRNRPNKNFILQLMRDDDFTDPWGTGMAWLGAVCDTLYDADPNMVPPQCQYRPGMGGPEVPGMTFGDRPDEGMRLDEVPFPTSMVWAWLHDVGEDWKGDVTDLPYWSDKAFTQRAEELVEAAVLLDRYLGWCRLAGRDY